MPARGSKNKQYLVTFLGRDGYACMCSVPAISIANARHQVVQMYGDYAMKQGKIGIKVSSVQKEWPRIARYVMRQNEWMDTQI